MTRKQALQEYADTIAQIELLKLKLPPLERVLLKDEWRDWSAAPATIERGGRRTPGKRTTQVLEVLQRLDEPRTAMEVAKQCRVSTDIVRAAIYKLIKEGRAKAVKGDPYVLYEAA